MKGPVPWHMWGNTLELTSNVDINGGITASRQLVKIAYKRPETWSFFFGAELLAGVTGNPNMDVVVLFDVMAGVGRSTFATQAAGNILAAPGFARFVFRFAPPFVPSETTTKYTTQGSGPPLDDTAATPVLPTIDWLVAEDIQVQARVRCSGGPGDSATVAVTALFAPHSHVRPDWLARVGRFQGEELDGH